MLLDRGADVNARAAFDHYGVGGQTPVFHAVTQFHDAGLPVARLLLERGADLSVRAKRSEEHTSELQSRLHLVCRLLLEKKKNTPRRNPPHNPGRGPLP